MILGVGIDIVSISRIETLIKKHGEKFKNRVFSETEIAESKKYENPRAVARHFAKRFAAKEAYVKAIGLGFNGSIRAKDISVCNRATGQPYLEIRTGAKHNIAISLSDDGDYAIASVTLYS